MKKVRMTVLILLIMAIAVSVMTGLADDLDEVWILCQKDSFVYVRMFPKKGSQELGRLELGESAFTDWKQDNGFLHIMVPGLESDGWIHKGYVSSSTVFVEEIDAKIASRGRVRCRRSINGTRRKWIKNDSNVKVFGYGDDWAVTDQGFIQMKFLTWEGKEE